MKQTIAYGTHPLQTLNLFLPDTAEKCPVYIYFHGGGLTGGTKEPFDFMGEFLNDHGIGFVSADYRLYPDARFPDYVEDCAAAVKCIYEHCRERISYIAVGGSSAGGYLSMMLFFDKRYLEDIPAEMLRGFLFDAGQPTTHFHYLEAELHMDSRRVLIDETAPLYYLDKEFSGFMPQVLILCSGHDMVNRAEQDRVLYTAMLHFGYDAEKVQFICYEDETHCGYVKKDFYMQEVLRFVMKCR